MFEPPVGLNVDEDSGSNTGGNLAASSGGGTPDDGSSGAGGGGLADASLDTSNRGPDGAVDYPLGPWWPFITDAPASCMSAGCPQPTDRPIGAAEPAGDAGDLPPIYFAISRLRVGTANDDKELTSNPDAWKDIGFDIDKSCTKSTTCEVNQVEVDDRACANGIPFDGNECRDNELGKLYNLGAATPTIGEYFGIKEGDWNCELHRGGFSIILKLSRYNGLPNDKGVRLDVYTSTGLQNPPGWSCRTTIDAPLATDWFSHANWLAESHWKIAEQSIDPAAPTPDDPKELPNASVADSTAFVRGGYFFAALPDGAIWWMDGENTPVPGFRQTMHRGIIVGRIVHEQDDTWSIDHGTVSFITTPGEMLLAFSELGFCENMCTAFDQVKSYLNTHQDTLSGTTDRLRDTACNGLSLAEAFEARQVTATPADLVHIAAPVSCPQPRHPAAPRQGCTCVNGTCTPTDGGSLTDAKPSDAGGN